MQYLVTPKCRFQHIITFATALVLMTLLLTGCGTNQIVSTALPTQTIALASPTPMSVATPTLTRAQWDATKIAILEGTEHERQTRVASGTPFASTPIPLTQVEPVTTPVLGISGECMDPSPRADFGNCWAERINDEYIFVATLIKKADITQGLLRVYTTTVATGDFGPVGWYSTPTHNGLIKVIDASGYQLTLRAEDSTLFYFDVLTRQWVDPPSGQSPTPVATSTLTRPDMDATKVARYEQQRQEWGAMATRIANGTPIVYTPIPIRTAAPRPSPVLGIYNGCADPDLIIPIVAAGLVGKTMSIYS